MATKPVTFPNLWASAGIYATGPFIGAVSVVDPGFGIANEGHRPGSALPTAAEHENYQQDRLTTWVRTWLALGSFAGAADAHILETDGFGRTAFVGATLVDAVDETCLDITAANTFVPAVTVTSAATSYQANMGNNAGIGFAAPIGTGAGDGFFSSLTGTAAGGAGVRVTADATSAGDGIVVTHAGPGVGVAITATDIGSALEVIGSALANFGATFVGGGFTSLFAQGVGGALGAIIQSSATAAAGALSVVLSNNTGFGIDISTPGGSATTARGIRSNVSGSAVAAEFVSPANYAAIFTGDTTAPTFPATFFTGQNARAGSTSNGGLMFLSTETQFARACAGDGTWRGLWDSESGYAYGGDVVAPSIFNGGAGWATALDFDALGGNAPKTLLGGSTIRVRINVNAASSTVGVDLTLGLRIRDMTAGGTPVIWTRSGVGAGDASGWHIVGYAAGTTYGPPISTVVELTVPLTGDRAWRLEYSFIGAAISVKIRDVSAEFLGLVP